jgi:hypothetical protein
MNIAWLFAENTLLPPATDVQAIKNVAPIWGSWRTQRGYQTDNVICWDPQQAQQLVAQGYGAICNLFIHQSVYDELDKPKGVRVFGGEFVHAVDSHDDVVGMHLVASTADVILMVGFDFVEPKNPTESRTNYLGLTAQVVRDHPKQQWVLIDHSTELAKPFKDQENITCDRMKNVLQLLMFNTTE